MSKNVLIVFAHPGPTSLTRQLVDTPAKPYKPKGIP